MRRIIGVLGLENKGEYAQVHVILDDGTEAQVYIGGSVEVFFHKGKIKAFIKRNNDIDKPNNVMVDSNLGE